ncbi:MAG: hypothetical protein LBB60_11075 [Desulfovibrio sp.]|jgi:hypothetical protein|nr:hypothetical protein [Desulfovibrio sp.]
MVRLKCTLCTGADTFSPGTVTEMDEADADSLAKSGYAEKIPVTRTASESPAQEQS